MGAGVNGVSADVYATYAATPKKATKTEEKAKTSAEETGVVYEKSAETSKKGAYSVTKMSAEDRAALVQQLKDDQANRQQSLIDIVQQMMGQQAKTKGLADLFSPENLAKVDPQTIAQAKKDVAEDGYWGVKQTSQRLFDFAAALAGDDVEKMKKMESAMMKGFDQATKAWGKELPQLCQDTINAAKELFAGYYASKEA